MQLPFQVLRFFHLASLLLPLTTFAGAACFSGPHLCKQRKTCSPGVTAGQLQDGSAPDSAGAQMVYYLRQNVSPSPITGYQGIISMPRLLSFLLLALLLGERAAEAARMPDQQTLSPSQAQEFTATADLTETGTALEPPYPAEATGHARPDDSAKPGAPSQEHPGERAANQAGDHVGDRAGERAGDQVAPEEQSARDSAAAIISGSRKPGIIEHQLVRDQSGGPVINISYPSVGSKQIDSDIRQWVTGIASAFEQSCNNGSFGPGAGLDGERPPYELWGSYSVTSPSPAGLSITFEVWTYTGGAHGNLDVMTLNYSLLTGQRLGLVDLFEDPDAALHLMSTWSYKELSRRLGGMRQEQMLRTGLNPVPENFASLTLTPQGVRINFQPYQVAPWAAGAQKVDMPLDQLLPASPLLRLWGR
ncbi:conserved exported hypothetical protein [uncultured Desulfovibrio sp.]|uniref:DUF3298 domain-containing protein n=2 Tax=Desulfovibrio TaxID=872 RepID=A0A212L0Z2_9BACT|nr:conserved exported hypothetical protein [uncultured Desulfovibrio sp.]VZH32818.1 conserved exported protein of unknown function [Desulfovibrio sp. 86]